MKQLASNDQPTVTTTHFTDAPGTITLHECDDCTELIPTSELADIEDFDDRVDGPDSPQPSGECPYCGSLCYPKRARNARDFLYADMCEKQLAFWHALRQMERELGDAVELDSDINYSDDTNLAAIEALALAPAAVAETTTAPPTTPTTAFSAAFQRVAAWRDNARMMMIRATPDEEPRWKAEYDNYAALCGELIQAGMEAPAPTTILVTVSGGIAEVVDFELPGVEVEVIDWDNLKDDPLAEFIALSATAQAHIKDTDPKFYAKLEWAAE